MVSSALLGVGLCTFTGPGSDGTDLVCNTIIDSAYLA